MNILDIIARSPLVAQAEIERAQENLRFNWELNARPKQLPPTGNWRFWVVRAGRGFGKTRTGAEYVRKLAKGGKHGRLAIIGPTAADVRDVMVEGESGIMSCSPNDFMPLYEPSKRQLTWPNGVIAKLYSGEEPDRLRGPQHSGGWCLAGSTKILMFDGTEKNICDVSAGEYVSTRSGPRKVVKSCLTSLNSPVVLLRLVDGRGIIGTAEHPVWIEGKGFTPIQSISGGMSACAITVSSGAAEHGTSSLTGTTLPTFGCIGRCGNRFTGLLKRASMFTTSTKTRLTSELKTFNCCLSRTIRNITSAKKLRQRGEPWVGSWLSLPQSATPSLAQPLSGSAHFAGRSMEAPLLSRGLFAPTGAWRRLGAEFLGETIGYALDAQSRMPQRKERKSIARSGATQWQPLIDLLRGSRRILSALRVGKYFRAHGQTQSFAVEGVRVSSATIFSVEPYPERLSVYNLTIEGAHEYFANGILTHNCDELSAWEHPEAFTQFKLGFRLGNDLRCVITMTPKPCPVVRELEKQAKDGSGRVVMVLGSTYENRANLSPDFFTDVVSQYEGTRIGRQELDGELLEDTPGALWNTAMIDRARVTEAPPMSRIIISIDPSVTSGEDSDECGLTVCGKGIDGDGYVIADHSAVLSPHEWAMEAIRLYHFHSADAVIAETNNGGDLVGNTILALDPSIPFRKVTASRGKHLRAEPVSALWEQGRAHTVGSYARLEEQMCSMARDGYTGKGSPDRLDSVVHGLTDLMLGPGTAQMFPDFRSKARESEGVSHIYNAASVALKDWWPRYVSAVHGYSSSAHWWCQEPSGRLRIYRELVLQDVTAELFGVEIAKRSRDEADSSRMTPVWLAKESFEKVNGKSTAALIAEGISKTLGESRAFLFVHNDEERHVADARQRYSMIESRLNKMPSGVLNVQSIHGGTGQSGWDIVRELLRWKSDERTAKAEQPDWEHARSLAATDITQFDEYMRGFIRPDEEVLPLLVISDECRALIQAMSGAVRNPNDEGALLTTGSAFVLQSLRIGALASREDRIREPKAEFVGRKLDALPGNASVMSRIIAAERAEVAWAGTNSTEPLSFRRV